MAAASASRNRKRDFLAFMGAGLLPVPWMLTHNFHPPLSPFNRAPNPAAPETAPVDAPELPERMAIPVGAPCPGVTFPTLLAFAPPSSVL